MTRADYAWDRNAAGAIVSEDSSISGDPTNGTSAFAYDELGRLASADPPTTATLAYGWDAVPNRTSVQSGAGTPVTYSYDAANRLYTDSASHTYTHDADGRVTVRPGDGSRPDEDLVFDDTGRLTRVVHVNSRQTTVACGVVAAVWLAFIVSACGPGRSTMASLCEATLYAAQARETVLSAIDAGQAVSVSAVRHDLDHARSDLAEARRSATPDDATGIAAVSGLVDRTASVADAASSAPLPTSISLDVDALETAFKQVQGQLPDACTSLTPPTAST